MKNCIKKERERHITGSYIKPDADLPVTGDDLVHKNSSRTNYFNKIIKDCKGKNTARKPGEDIIVYGTVKEARNTPKGTQFLIEKITRENEKELIQVLIENRDYMQGFLELCVAGYLENKEIMVWGVLDNGGKARTVIAQHIIVED